MASPKTSRTPAPSAVAANTEPTTSEPTVIEATPIVQSYIETIPARSTDELKAVMKAARTELKEREEKLAVTRPTEGTMVQIAANAPKRWAGRKGTVLLAGKSRVFVKVEGFIQAANVPLSMVEAVKAAEA